VHPTYILTRGSHNTLNLSSITGYSQSHTSQARANNVNNHFHNRNNGYSDGLFSKNTNVENNTLGSIEGATALKLDEKFEVNEQSQQTIFDNLEQNYETMHENVKIPEVNENKPENIPSGLSMENASYIENSDENYSSKNNDSFINNEHIDAEDDHTPRLFSEDNEMHVKDEDVDENDHNTEKLFDQDLNEDEDFEIPAFLRKQKF